MQRRFDAGVGMAQDHRAPGTNKIDVPPVILVIEIGALGVFEKDRSTANTTECPYRGVHAAGNVFLGLFKEGFGMIHGCLLLFGK